MFKLLVRVMLMIIWLLVREPVAPSGGTIRGALARLHVSTIFCNVLL